ncbi:MAG: hypothetical protein GY869_04845, partial [Planctomycetes bacterium]|nr:hypothetical protein [Planctomycetota bacterium]
MSLRRFNFSVLLLVVLLASSIVEGQVGRLPAFGQADVVDEIVWEEMGAQEIVGMAVG